MAVFAYGMIAAELEDVVGVAAAIQFWSVDSFIGESVS
jgi:hypothetical protein